MSRPMFVSFLREEINRGSSGIPGAWKKLLGFARDKFLGDWSGSISSIEKADEVTDMALGILCARFPLIPASLARGEELVSFHLATLTYVCPDRDRIFCKYVAAPVIGETVAGIIHDDWRHYRIYFQKLLEMRSDGDVGVIHSQGDVGEFVGMAMLMYAFDCSIRQTNFPTSQLGQIYGSPVPLNTFLSYLVPNYECNAILEGAFVSFLQFGKMQSKLFVEILAKSYNLRLALALRDNSFALDLVVPIERAERMSAIFIQIKNPGDSLFEADVKQILSNMSHQEVNWA